MSVSMRFLVFFISTFLTADAYASAKVSYDAARASVELTAQLYFYGPGADAKTVQVIIDEINLYWNGGTHLNPLLTPLSVTIDSHLVRFHVHVTGQALSRKAEKELKHHSRSPEDNFIKLFLRGGRSGMGLCSQEGTWYGSDQLGTSTTAAHEFGHGLCLNHPKDLDQRGTGQPSLMDTRGTLVDPEFQWSSTAVAEAAGGTLNPSKRKLTQSDLDQLHLDKLTFDPSGIAYLKK